MDVLKTFGLFVVTALAEIIGCYLPYLWLKEGQSVWLLVWSGPAQSGRLLTMSAGPHSHDLR